MGPMSIDTSSPGLSLHGFPGAMCGGYVMRPESQGSILIGGLDSATPAIIHPNYLATDYDRPVSVALFPFIRAMFTQPALAPFLVGATAPSSGCETADAIIARSAKRR